jgi:hypothetical protein
MKLRQSTLAHKKVLRDISMLEGNSLMGSMQARMKEITGLLDGRWVNNPNKPTGMEDAGKYLKPKRENVSRRKSEVKAEL